MIKYGLISEVDGRTIEKTLDLLLSDQSNNYPISVVEIGVYGGDTGRGICEYIKSKGRNYWITGIDNRRDGEVVRFPYNEMIYGNSTEVYNQIEDESQHLCFIDGLHTFAGVISDFFCYAPKVKKGGFLAFHDTGKHINPLHGWQGVGDKNDPDFCLGGVRKALNKCGLLYDDEPEIGSLINENDLAQWKLVFDESDPNDEAGGICCFRKIN